LRERRERREGEREREEREEREGRVCVYLCVWKDLSSALNVDRC